MGQTVEMRRTQTGAPHLDLPWWKGAVIYQIYPRSFRDTNGDGIGDLMGIHTGLDHIAELGVDGIWISPFFTSPMADYGYDVADFCGVDPIFGTLDDFDRVVEKAHRLGLKVIIDQVYSHTSDQHPWFIDSRSSKDSGKSDWYVWADAKSDGGPPNNWLSVFGGSSWEWDARRGQYFLHNFLKEQPDLNVHNRDVQDALIEAGRFWLDRGIDGFRLDALNFTMHDPNLTDNPPSGVTVEDGLRPFYMQKHVNSMSQPGIVDFIARFGEMLKAYPDTFTVAEVGGPDPINEMKSFTHGDHRLNSAYNFDFLYAADLTAQQIKTSAQQWTQSEDEGWPSWAFSNHDAPRAVTRWAPPEQREEMARLCMLLLLALRGNPIIYQGEELGLPQAQVPFESLMDPEAIMNWPNTLGRDGARTPFPWRAAKVNAGFSSAAPWLSVDPEHAALARDTQMGAGSMMQFTREALNVRKAHPALRHGSMRFLDDFGDETLVIERVSGSYTTIALFNLSDQTRVAHPARFATHNILLGSRDLSGDQVRSGELPARTAIWIGLDN